MNHFNQLVEESNKYLYDLSIYELEKELNSYMVLFHAENFDTSIIMEKIIFINSLIKEKKNK